MGKEDEEPKQEDKEFLDWNEGSRRKEFDEYKKSQATQQSNPQGGDDSRIVGIENDVAELKKVTQDAGLTSKSLNTRKDNVKKGNDEGDTDFFDFLSF